VSTPFPFDFLQLQKSRIIKSNFVILVISTKTRPCPKMSSSSVLLLFHPETNECYEKETKGPCSENMKFYSFNGTTGECHCDQLSSRMLVYHKKTKNCFPIFQRVLLFNENQITTMLHVKPLKHFTGYFFCFIRDHVGWGNT